VAAFLSEPLIGNEFVPVHVDYFLQNYE